MKGYFSRQWKGRKRQWRKQHKSCNNSKTNKNIDLQKQYNSSPKTCVYQATTRRCQGYGVECNANTGCPAGPCYTVSSPFALLSSSRGKLCLTSSQVLQYIVDVDTMLPQMVESFVARNLETQSSDRMWRFTGSLNLQGNTLQSSSENVRDTTVLGRVPVHAPAQKTCEFGTTRRFRKPLI